MGTKAPLQLFEPWVLYVILVLWLSLLIRFSCLYRITICLFGVGDTERFDHMPLERKEKMIANTVASLPLQRIGQPEDMGNAIYYLLTAPFCTGVILDVDGGHGIRQYASVVGDPMRSQQK
jgi:Enoyl-(Acyl carrier protein) reductase